jgi:hypothetical protein
MLTSSLSPVCSLAHCLYENMEVVLVDLYDAGIKRPMSRPRVAFLLGVEECKTELTENTPVSGFMIGGARLAAIHLLFSHFAEIQRCGDTHDHVRPSLLVQTGDYEWQAFSLGPGALCRRWWYFVPQGIHQP